MPSGARPAPPDGTCRVSFEGSFGSTRWANVMWLLLTGTPLTANLQDLAGDLHVAFSTNLHTLAQFQNILDDTKLTYYSSSSGDKTVTHSTSVAGDVTGNPLPAQCAQLVSWTIADSYRGGHPRTYLPAPSIDKTNGVKQWTDTHTGNLSDGANAFLDAVNALTETNISTVTLGTVSFQTGGAWRTPPVFRPFLEGTGQKRVCTIRNRLGSEF